MTGGVISVPFSLLLMSLVMPYSRLSQIVGSTQLIGGNELPLFLRSINHACLILGIIVLFAIIPSMLRGKTNTPASSLEKRQTETAVTGLKTETVPGIISGN